MSVDPATFESIVPSRFVTFIFPNPSPSNPILHNSFIRVAVLDSPSATDPHKIAAMIVPLRRESDWIFSTEAGHLQLLFSMTATLSRLILVGNMPLSSEPTSYDRPSLPMDNHSMVSFNVEQKLTPLLFALLPKRAFPYKSLPQIPFLSYEDDVIRSVVVERCVGSCVGEMLIEDVELEIEDGSGECIREFRRRLRFKRMPNLIQTQMRIHANTSVFEDLNDVQFTIDKDVLVHPYLIPMVAGLSLIGSYLDRRIQSGFRPRALCLGVGGGALLGFLNTQLGFEVLGVEADEVVLGAAKQHFGLEGTSFVRLLTGDGIEFIKNGNKSGDIKGSDTKFDVLMIDLDSIDPKEGISAPPLEFFSKSVLLAAKLVICEHGVLVINVIPPCISFYENLKHVFLEIFPELHEIDVGNENNHVLIASGSPVGSAFSNNENSFLSKLRGITSREYIESIRKVELEPLE